MASSLGVVVLSFLVLVCFHVLRTESLSYAQSTSVVSPQDDKSASSKTTAGPSPYGRVAYVTLLYGRGFELGVRVLGQSLRESGTNIEYVCLCTPDVPESTREVLKKDGWVVKVIQLMDPGEARFDGTFNKMQIWTLTEYRRIVWIDADAIVLQNIDHLFRCGDFCAVYRHSDLFNSGIMVVKPSLTELDKILKLKDNFNILPHDAAVNSGHIWGDQNILNEFYNQVYGLKYARMFDKRDPSHHEEPMRLPAGYNMDIGIYCLDGHWYLPESERYILHYTLGPMKPNKWWSYPVFDVNWKWYELRHRLPSRYNEYSLWDFSNLLPVFLVISLVGSFRFISFRYRLLPQSFCERLCRFVSFDRKSWLMSVLPLTLALTSAYFSFFFVPTSITPKSGWFMYIMWLVIFLCLLYGPLCYVLYMGSSKESGYARKLIESVFYVVVFIILCFLSLFILSRITSFHVRCKLVFMFVFFLLIHCHFAGKRVLSIWYSSGTRMHSTLCLPS